MDLTIYSIGRKIIGYSIVYRIVKSKEPVKMGNHGSHYGPIFKPVITNQTRYSS